MLIEDLLTEISIVPYDIACKLKELGYPQESLLSYVKTISEESSADYYTPHLEFFGAIKGELGLPDYEVVAAPSITSVLAWIYDKYQVNIYVKSVDGNNDTITLELFHGDKHNNLWGYVIQDLSPRAKFMKDPGADVPAKYTVVDLQEIVQTEFYQQPVLSYKNVYNYVIMCGIAKFLSLI